MIITSRTLCEHCGSCSAVCPTKSILIVLDEHEMGLHVDSKTCTDCGNCVRVCPVRALSQKRKQNKPEAS